MSYPGDQGGEPILADSESGRLQERRNPDIFAQFKTKSGKNDKKGVLLVESKEKFLKAQIQADIKKIDIFKDKNSKYYKALNDHLQNLRNSTDNPNADTPTRPEVVLAVGFFKGRNYTLEKLREFTINEKTKKYTIDYAFVISSEDKKWEIVELGKHGDFGKNLKGDYSIPIHYAVKKS